LNTGGLELQISGTSGNDRIVVYRVADGLAVTNTRGFWQTTLDDDNGTRYDRLRLSGARGDDRLIVDDSVNLGAILNGAGGNDSLTGGAGNDSIYGGSGRDRVMAGAGDDLIVSLDIDHKEQITGGEGLDSFWVDAAADEIVTDLSAEELAYGANHRVVTFNTPAMIAGANPAVVQQSTQPVPRDLYDQELPDPSLSSTQLRYVSFSDRPLFGEDGPLADDVRQGNLSDCYLLAPLSSLAAIDPQIIRQTIAELGDGTYGVRFFRAGGQEVYYRIDDDLPTSHWMSDSTGNPVFSTSRPAPAYAHLGAGDAMWVALIEKAFAFFRRGEGTYSSLNFGWMSDLYGALGERSAGLYSSQASGVSDLLNKVYALISAGRYVSMGTISSPRSDAIIGSHAYWVVRVNYNREGKAVSVLMRNPWARDGGTPRDASNDGYVTVTSAEIYDSLLGFSYV
jgi:hypothetical protein